MPAGECVSNSQVVGLGVCLAKGETNKTET